MKSAIAKPSQDVSASGVDDRAPGGVGTLLKRFEVQSPSGGQSPTAAINLVKKGMFSLCVCIFTEYMA